MFYVNSGVTASISGLTVRHGRLSAPIISNPPRPQIEGGTGTDGRLSAPIISGDAPQVANDGFGAGIFNEGTLTISDSTISANSTNGSGGGVGGGIYNASNGTVTITNSTISGNFARDSGGGIGNTGTLNVTNSTISGNSTNISAGQGGGIANSGTLTVTNSTISGNSSSGGGGINNSSSGAVTVTNSTITSNTAGLFCGGGIYNSATSTVNSRSSIIANNICSGAGFDIVGTLTSQGYNLIGVAGAISGGSNDIVIEYDDAMLGPLANNGGPTETHAVLPGSPALDKGINALVPLTADQRGAGFARTVDNSPTNAADGTDIGAYEAPLSGPTVTAVNPTSGSVIGGNSVTITGTGFTGVTGVTFDGNACTSVNFVSDTEINCTAPAHSAGSVSVLVSTPGGTNGPNLLYTYVAAPTVTAVNPASGPTAGGTVVTLTGTNFTGTIAVTFGTTAATTFTVDSPTQITATSPARTAGIINVRVTTAGGTSAVAVANRFTYVAPPTVTLLNPTSGSALGGNAVAIGGTNFTGATSVMFGATSAAFTFNNASSITATAPAGSAGTVNVTVTTPGGTSATAAANQYTYLTPLNGTYTVGVGGDFATLTAAAAAYNTRGVSGPVTFSLIDSSYNSETYPISISAALGSSTTNTLTIKPAAGQTPAFSGSFANPFLFMGNTASNIIIDGSNQVGGTSRDLSFANSDGSFSGNGLYILGSNITVKNVAISATGVGTALRLDDIGTNVVVDNCAFAPVTGSLRWAIAAGATVPNIPGPTVTNNQFTQALGTAIEIYNMSGSVIRGNTMDQSDGTGIDLQSGVETFGATVIDRNLIRGAATGINLIAGQPTDLLTVSNNMISRTSSPGDSIDPVGIWANVAAGTVNVYHNSVGLFGSSDGVQSIAFLALGGNSPGSFDIRNNIFVNSTLHAGGPNSGVVLDSTSGTAMNYNDIYVTGAGAVFGSPDGGATQLTSLAQWQSATGLDANSISSDPLFVSATDLHVSPSSPVSNIGTPIAAVTTDFDDEARSVTTPDIGADEFATVLETTVTVSGGNLLIEDTNGGTSNDDITIACSGSDITITDPGTGLNQTIPTSSVTGSITVNTYGGNDTLTVDLSGCDFITAPSGGEGVIAVGGLFFNGGAGGDDALNITGYSGGTTTYNYLNANDGDIVMVGGTRTGTITYTGLEPIVNSGTAADVIFNLPAGPANIVHLTDAGSGSSTLTAVTATFETTTFANPTGSITVNRGNATDTLNAFTLAANYPGLTIGSPGFEFLDVSFEGTIGFGTNKNVSTFVSQTQYLQNAASDLTMSGTGSISLTAGRNIFMGSGSSISVVNGNATLNANQQAIPNPGYSVGIEMFDAVIETTGTGSIVMNGKGGSGTTAQTNAFASSMGIALSGTSCFVRSTSASAGAGTITIDGRATSTGDAPNIGVFLNGGGSITSVVGNIGITARGGDSTGGANVFSYALDIRVPSVISSTGTGAGAASITIDALGGNITPGAGSSRGVIINTATTGISSVDGPVNITATGGSSSAGSSYGFSTFGPLSVANADLTLIGVGGSGNVGQVSSVQLAYLPRPDRRYLPVAQALQF
ncbi:MAG: IPT/TIG domain-containing protein [Acidobacteria bacterium]|nr:IPT/TIG domain-containing protein [Acidobacteriota bacterium]